MQTNDKLFTLPGLSERKQKQRRSQSALSDLTCAADRPIRSLDSPSFGIGSCRRDLLGLTQ